MVFNILIDCPFYSLQYLTAVNAKKQYTQETITNDTQVLIEVNL